MLDKEMQERIPSCDPVVLFKRVSKNNRLRQRIAAVFEELLAFRAALLAKPGMKPGDIVHLRGPKEEAWQRLLRLQFSPVPPQTLEQLMAAGVEAYVMQRLPSITE